MIRFALCTAILAALTILVAASDDDEAAVAVEVAKLSLRESAKYTPDLPEGAEGYAGAYYTQEIAVTNDRDRISPFPIHRHEDTRWHQPGGLEKARRSSWRSDKYRTLPEGTRVKAWIGNIEVDNGIPTGRIKADGKPEHFHQRNRGMLRSYPDGTRFDEVLVNVAMDQVFEHRIREKHDGKWHSDIIYRNPKARPEGYEPVSLTQCASCHSEAGTGKYADGLVPGGDGVLSDPLPWHLIGINPETDVRLKFKVELKATDKDGNEIDLEKYRVKDPTTPPPPPEK